jgi:hypothetical protein
MKGSLHRMEESYAKREIPRSNFRRIFADAPENEAAEALRQDRFLNTFEKSLNRSNIYENRFYQS